MIINETRIFFIVKELLSVITNCTWGEVMLDLMYITNRPEVAKIAESSGVNRIFVDMEYIGKSERQKGLDTVKSRHTISDIQIIRKVITKSEVLVRVNPIHDESNCFSSSEIEIDQAIKAGADILMLPMFKTVREVDRFFNCVAGRCKTMLLVETPEAVLILKDILEQFDVDEIHIGLNDLHLALKKAFMFELLADGTVDKVCDIVRPYHKNYGFGGIARLGYGTVPAEYIITEHYRLGSHIAILSRSFCNANIVENPEDIANLFYEGVAAIRSFENKVSLYTNQQYEENRKKLIQLVESVVEKGSV